MGNVALIDCRYAYYLIKDAYDTLIQRIVEFQPLAYVFIGELDKFLTKQISKLNFCDFALTIEGTLKNQVQTYLKDIDQIQLKLGKEGNELMKSLTIDSNISFQTPLQA